MSELRLNTLIFISKKVYGLNCKKKVFKGVKGSYYSLVTCKEGVSNLAMTSIVEV